MLNSNSSTIEFTNEVSREMLKTILEISDLTSNTDVKSGRVNPVTPLDRQVFFLFEVTDE